MPQERPKKWQKDKKKKKRKIFANEVTDKGLISKIYKHTATVHYNSNIKDKI